MTRIPQEKAEKGSQKWLQVIINQHQDMLDDDLKPRLGMTPNDTITWLSPLAGDQYAEYRDNEFLQILGISLLRQSLDSFWPRGGPVWDGLARTSRGDIILVEAKSHISEMVSTCQASNESRDLIRKSLREAATFYGSSTPDTWESGFYQYANRLAHLYVLRQLNDLPTWLLFVNFVNDIEMSGPTLVEEWQTAINGVHIHLGIQPERLQPYVIDLFEDVQSICV